MGNTGPKIFFNLKKKRRRKRKEKTTTQQHQQKTKTKQKKKKKKKRMTIKIVKIYLTLSLVLWAVWGHFQGDSLCLTSSVCWSLQCLISILTQRGRWWTLFFFFFLGSLVQSRCGEGGMLQTNNTGMCLQCLSPAGPAPARGAHHSGSTLLHRKPSEAGPRMHAPSGLGRSGWTLR